ncbi:uncharacterized protein DUF4292 [Chitinophaga skermanii]|uniref:Uncharacterized protein DUF4292 n=1 Tax=Chitinophaga skermanii TaxID=331697 RepID=A0A327R4F8_9BACT|nr:DUF4292 domain-containing protein [Chitinophaga skermanii]RAJ10613.1 uncharacterized protein DUF4292 [Chitinophaga skermanii]
MKQKVLLHILSVLIIGMVTVSCRSSKKLARPETGYFTGDSTKLPKDSSGTSVPKGTDPAEVKTLLDNIQKNHIDFKTYSAKLKADFESDKGESMNNLNVDINMIKDSVVWISVSVPIVGEVARVLITPDSLKLVDRYHKEMMLRDIRNASDVLGIPFDFSTIQDLLVGNPVFLNDSVSQIVKTPTLISFSCVQAGLTSLFNVYPDDYSLQQSKVSGADATGQQRSCELTYGNYKVVDGRKLPFSRRIFIEDKRLIKVAMDFTRVEFNKDKVTTTFNFQPSKFKQK